MEVPNKTSNLILMLHCKIETQGLHSQLCLIFFFVSKVKNCKMCIFKVFAAFMVEPETRALTFA